MADSLDKLRSDLEKRIREIEPLIAEHAQLRKALEALKGVGGSRLGRVPRRRAGALHLGLAPARRVVAGRAGRVLARSRF